MSSTTWIAASAAWPRSSRAASSWWRPYDAAGFRSYHVAEHHATSLGMAPSPGIYLAAVAQRTRRLRFGPLVYILPLYRRSA